MAQNSQLVFGMCPYDDLVQMACRISRFQGGPSSMRFNKSCGDVDDELDDSEDEGAFEMDRGNSGVQFRVIGTDVGLESIQTYFRAEAF